MSATLLPDGTTSRTEEDISVGIVSGMIFVKDSVYTTEWTGDTTDGDSNTFEAPRYHIRLGAVLYSGTSCMFSQGE